ncbi:hypothetical protein I4641_13755 [Waterburya agarophytonicola K14]|uniref:SprT-like domain-containing protein n=1 Tax=Waterburya agarophytonicola KI4 TaxID=2874699 RepID=A0A964FFQ1_9CYAN|nr:hypothetical protein [Waterburya agarophytonicola]MCC0178045.1 hypothetical protein [Waterburya agarophytonicola KI4]
MNKNKSSSSILETLKAASDITDPGYGRWAYELWESHNENYFDGKLEPGAIHWGCPPAGHSANYDFTRNIITFSTLMWLRTIDGKAISVGDYRRRIKDKAAFSDYLLHEMIHQAIHQRHGKDGESYTIKTKIAQGQVARLYQQEEYDVVKIHKCKAWYDEVNRLNSAKFLNVAPGKIAKDPNSNYENAMSYDELIRFPYIFRDYFIKKVNAKGKRETNKGRKKQKYNFFPD